MSISTQFIDQLFSNQHFKYSLEAFNSLKQKQYIQDKQKKINFEIQTVIDDITDVLYTNFKATIQQECSNLYKSNQFVLEQIQNLKNKLHSASELKIQSSTAQRDTKSKLQTSIFFDSDQQYDMKQIRKSMQYFQYDVQNKVLTNSFELEQQQKVYADFQIQQKINASIQGSINRIQLSLQQKFEKYSQKLQQRIEQLKKTITSVVEAMNDPQYWNRQKSNREVKKEQKIVVDRAFSKKQIKKEQNCKQKADYSSFKGQINQEKGLELDQCKREVKNPQQKSVKSSNKAMQQLNKSINLGRSKIKSLFGFKSSNKKPKDIQQTFE